MKLQLANPPGKDENPLAYLSGCISANLLLLLMHKLLRLFYHPIPESFRIPIMQWLKKTKQDNPSLVWRCLQSSDPGVFYLVVATEEEALNEHQQKLQESGEVAAEV